MSEALVGDEEEQAGAATSDVGLATDIGVAASVPSVTAKTVADAGDATAPAANPVT